MSLPYVVNDIDPIPGTIKGDYEDFQVEEIPLYEPCGEGDHTYVVIEKRGLTTHQAVRDIGRALGVKPQNIGVAGNKDARAVTRQTLSVEHVPLEKIEALSLPRLTVIRVSRHRNKLKIGHLWGNRFTIRLRDTDLQRLDDVERVLERLHRGGVPNYFGPQRFGNRGDTWEIGQALLIGKFSIAASLIAGRPSDEDTGAVAEARALFDAGEYNASSNAWPSGFQECVLLARGMTRHRGDAERAVKDLSKKTLGLYVSAIQSELFNRILARRIQEMDKLRDGDVAWKHENGAAFLVEDAATEQPRADRFEISPTGPMFGKRMKSPAHQVADLENEVLEGAGMKPTDFPPSGPFRCAGGRRPLRFRPEHPTAGSGEDERGEFIEVSFSLRAGCYATSVLREISKEELLSSPGFRVPS